LGVRLEHWTYEFEGDPEPALRQAHAFESYLEQRPKHERRSEIELRIAYLYYLAQEFISEKDEGAEAFPAADAGTYRARAEAIYARLSNATDPAVAAEARIQLFNLREGRRISVNANKW